MKRCLRGIISLTVILTMSTIGISMLLPVAVQAAYAVPSFSATEQVMWSDASGADLAFTVTNDGYTDIVEFAIGNPGATDAWTDWNFNLKYGGVAHKDVAGQWTTYVSGYEGTSGWVSGFYRDLDWMEAANSGFAGEDTAFIFTSWDTYYDGVSGSGGFSGLYLETGFTDGYSGTTFTGLASPVAAFSYSGSGSGVTINGGEAAPVPIPGALWLLGSGLIGLVGFRRKK